jgi:hypothetical protein
MGNIRNKLAELRCRVLELESQLDRQARQAAFLAAHGRHPQEADDAIAATRKHLTSLKRSCAILARDTMAGARGVDSSTSSTTISTTRATTSPTGLAAPQAQ